MTRSSSLGFSRTETTTYADNRADWTPYVLGLVETVTEAGGKVMLANAYHPTAATLLTTSRFGQLDKTMSYHADGTVAARSDPLGHVTSFSNYMRGIARNVAYPDSTTESAEVSNIGKITSITDPNGYTTSYDYDAMGRISRFIPPAEAGIPWNPTTFDFVPVQSSEFDLVPGHWRRKVTTGNAVTSIYFDALWRPVYTLAHDAADFANTTQLVKQSYDVDGRVTFASYPTSYGGNVDIGVRTEYDALGRPTFTRADSELGVLVASNTYGSPFTKTHTDARNNSSTSTFQAFDTPSEDAVIALSAPMELHVDIRRDVFGKPQSISRSGGGAGATRSYVYDQNERLCKTIEPGTGAEGLR